MASAGTLLSELDAKGPSPQDSDLVEKIMMDMNLGGGGSGGGNPVQMPSRGMSAPPPPLPASASPGMVQAANSFPTASDPYTAQAHVIGRDHPTPGDFAAAMHGVNRSLEPPSDGGYGNGPSTDYGYDMGVKKNMYARVLDELKTPLIVALLFFVLSLPAVNILVQHYLPSLILPTGSLTMVGLIGKALLAGGAFWLLTRIVAPLLKA